MRIIVSLVDIDITDNDSASAETPLTQGISHISGVARIDQAGARPCRALACLRRGVAAPSGNLKHPYRNADRQRFTRHFVSLEGTGFLFKGVTQSKRRPVSSATVILTSLSDCGQSLSMLFGRAIVTEYTSSVRCSGHPDGAPRALARARSPSKGIPF